MRSDRLHIAQKPLALMLDLVTLVRPGGLILDPFAGSGTTGIAAIRQGRQALLFEVRPENAGLIRDRCAAEVEGLDLSAARSGQLGLLASD